MDRMKNHIPNALSILRMVMVVPFIYALAYDDTLGIILIMITMLSSDYIDGYLARRWNAVSELGRVLDPLADKFAVAAIGIVLVFLRDFPLWLMLIMMARDVVILLAGLYIIRRDRPVPVSNNLGRFTVAVFAAAMIVYIFRFDILKSAVVILALAMVAASSISYARFFLRSISSSSGRGEISGEGPD